MIMSKIKPTIFTITKEEVEEIFKGIVEERILNANLKLNKEQIVNVLESVECDEFLAKDIHMSIKSSIVEVLFYNP